MVTQLCKHCIIRCYLLAVIWFASSACIKRTVTLVNRPPSRLLTVLLNQGDASVAVLDDAYSLRELSLPGVQRVLSAADALLSAREDTHQPSLLLRRFKKLVARVRLLSSTRHTYPLTRRLVTAALRAANSALLQVVPAANLTRNTAAVRRHFMHLLEQGRLQKGNMLHFFHIPKTGGTSVCALAAAQYPGSATDLTSKNCHVEEFNDFGSWADVDPTMQVQYWRRGHWLRGPDDLPHATCEQRASVCADNNIAFHANEYVLPDSKTDGLMVTGAVCPQFVNLILLRNPVSRSFSNILHFEQMYRWNNATHRFPRHFDGISRLSPVIVNNMYLRSLLGAPAYSLPYDAMTEQHLQAAKLKLLQFDVLLLLEQPDESSVILQQTLGWQVNMREQHSNALGSFIPEVMGEAAFERLIQQPVLPLPEMLYYLAQSNQLDMVLYTFAQRLFETDHYFFTRL